jgi:hypothetical protein
VPDSEHSAITVAFALVAFALVAFAPIAFGLIVRATTARRPKPIL